MSEDQKKRRMKKTFVCDESMIITIPIGSLRDAREGRLMPERFQCVYRDFYKVFAIKGKPKPLGAAQAISGVFIITLGLILTDTYATAFTLPCAVFVLCGILSYAAGHYPNIHVTKLAFSLNIISFFWSVAVICLFAVPFHLGGPPYSPFRPHGLMSKIGREILALIIALLIVEMVIALFLIYWLSKAVCRQHFNTLPIILLKQGD